MSEKGKRSAGVSRAVFGVPPNTSSSDTHRAGRHSAHYYYAKNGRVKVSRSESNRFQGRQTQGNPAFLCAFCPWRLCVSLDSIRENRAQSNSVAVSRSKSHRNPQSNLTMSQIEASALPADSLARGRRGRRGCFGRPVGRDRLGGLDRF